MSWVFFAWHVPHYIFLIVLCTGVSFYAAKFIGRFEHLSDAEPNADNQNSHQLLLSKIVLGVAIGLILSMLLWFKYAGFFATVIADILSLIQAEPDKKGGTIFSDLILPIGISFYSFQAISYVVDVYRGKTVAEQSFVRLAFYIAFFPQLVAGPIVRARDFLYQLQRKRRFRLAMFSEGGYLILRGLFLKIVIADNLGQIVDKYWQQTADDPSGLLATSLLVFFAFQLLCDFAGYSDIARGIAYQLGFRLPVNFNAPYIATSFAEFWQRWHITLSSWLRDYVYIPLGGNRYSNLLTLRNLAIVMVLSGLWHGANYTFLIWGCILGLALAVERGLASRFNLGRLASPLGLIWVQLVWIVSLAFFRSENSGQAIDVLSQSVRLPIGIYVHSIDWQMAEGLVIFGWVLIVPACLMHLRVWLQERFDWSTAGLVERSAYAGFMLACILMMYSSTQAFIYFQF